MVIVSIMGGLGNQLFQYSFAKYVEQQFNIETLLACDMLSAYGNRRLDIEKLGLPFKQVSREQLCEGLGLFNTSPLIRRILANKHFKCLRKKTFITDAEGLKPDFMELIHKKGNLYFHGYWQKSFFYESVRDSIWNGFNFPNFTTKDEKEWAIRISDSPSVGIHVRRGDYLISRSANKRFGLLSDSYYVTACRYFSKHLDRPEFFIFSDDPNFIAKKFPALIDGPVHVVSTNQKDSWSDMQLMSYCHHNIISNSTYSWWGATLNRNIDKIVIAPNPWYADGSTSDGLLPDTWVTLNRE